MQDIVSSQKRSIRNISIDRPQSSSSVGDTQPHEQTADSFGMSLPPRVRGGAPSRWKRYAIRGGIVCAGLIVLAVVLSSLFSHGTVTVVPKRNLVSLDHPFTLLKTPTEENTVSFNTVSIDKEGNVEIPATGEERIEKAATGRIVVYNNSSESPLLLIKNTRFATPDGLVFRTPTSVSVPGPSKNAKGETVPGSMEIEVYADAVGEKYNIGLTDFVLPAFRENNDPLFEQVYARSKTPMEGGFEGVVRTAAKADTDAAYSNIKTQLESNLTESILASVPDGYIAIPETVTVSFENLPNMDGSSAGMVSVRMKGTAYVAALEEAALGSSIARQFVADYKGAPVRFQDTNALTITTAASSTDITTATELPIKVTGVTDLVWQFDHEQLAEDLAGKRRSAADAIVDTYPGIESMNIAISPFWRRSLPSNVEDIDIVVDSTK